MKKTAAAACAFAFALLALPAQAQTLNPQGVWASPTGETKVRVANCGSQLCGTIVYTAQGGKDEKNPDASLRGRSLVGVRMMTFSGSDNSYAGSLYDYTSGKTYSGKMTMTSANSMRMSGCVLGILCKSQNWSRAN